MNEPVLFSDLAPAVGMIVASAAAYVAVRWFHRRPASPAGDEPQLPLEQEPIRRASFRGKFIKAHKARLINRG